jgi:alpha-tubulin suppressor-like RCC1 family protein
MILIDSQGGVFSAGSKVFGQLGRSPGAPSTFSKIENIPPMLATSCGLWHTLCVDENGGAWAWGCGEDGQLGTGNNSDQSQPTIISSLEGMSALVAGRRHSLAFSQNGSLLVFGCNNFGELGLHNTYSQIIPTRSLLQPALPHSVTRSKQKSARF